MALPLRHRRRLEQLRPSVQSVHLPAPIGGMNTVDGASALPKADCLYLYNMIPAEYGLRVRLGYLEWCTGLTGGSTAEVRSILPFSGSHKNGSTDKLFAVTQSGIWDVSTSTDSPTHSVSFATQTGEAGFGTSCVCATQAGRFLLFCDEENGLYVYSENSSSWSQVAAGATQLWAPSTAYAVGNRVVNGGKVYECSVAGTSAGSGGPTGTGSGIADNTASWNYISASAAGVIGPSLADQRAGFTGDPANFVFCTVFKSRVWFVERDTSRGWYLDVNSIFGTATSFDFGGKMRAGGPLAGLYNWSYDGGSGLDTLLVGISTAGDVVIYQGTDPSSASTFGLKGCWYVGGVPAGRRIATDYGGDLLILSLLGVLPLSKLVVGGSPGQQSLYATRKIGNRVNLYASTYRLLSGWALHVHPTDNALLILVPTVEGQPTIQLAMSFSTKGWAQYRELPMLAAGVWNGQLYFGTVDGRVCRNSGYVDNVQLADPDAFGAVSYSVLTAYHNLGNARQKRIGMVRPTLMSETPGATAEVTAKFGFDLLEPDPPMGGAVSGASTIWDAAIWDQSIWGGEYTPSQRLTGSAGMGRDVAIAVRGSAVSRTVLVGIDVFFDQGGPL